jgi:uncharacterized protein YecE (DUF72 family)
MDRRIQVIIGGAWITTEYMWPISLAATRKPATVLVGCAGWTIPRIARYRFPSEGSSLQRYAAKLPAVEINSSFYRSHRPATYARWADGVPAPFRFSVKVPKTITHAARLIDTGRLLDAFVAQVSLLGSRLGCLLVQLPPGLAFDSDVAEAFFVALRGRYAGSTALEPRHPTWFTIDVERLLVAHRISRVAADPAISTSAGEPGGWPDFVYYRLHGSPRVYFSVYEPSYIEGLATKLQEHARAGKTVYCIFDNTALGHASLNALDLLAATRS